MPSVLLLASEGVGHKTLWNPTLVGILVVVCAFGLFCGSVYLLLSTNLGARLGFLVAAACLSGFMVLLSTLWMTTATPLTSPKGRPSKWVVTEVVNKPEGSVVSTVASIRDQGEALGVEDLGNLRPYVEAALVRVAGESAAPAEGAVAPIFASASEFLVDFDDFESWSVGGDTKNLFWHNPRYAAVQFCSVKEVTVPPGGVAPEPECDPLATPRYAVMEYDFGSIRQPPVFYFLGSLVLFVLSLLGLHWREKDERARAAAAPATT